MTFQDYTDYFEAIINKSNEEQAAPYNNPAYLEYTRLNWARMKRWLKTGKLADEFQQVLKNIQTPQHWIVITEPWCGDAAHIVPFIQMASVQNPLITVSYELRDSAPFRIDDYLTHGTKSIPKLVVRNQQGNDLSTWGPRPAGCQALYDDLKAAHADFETVKTSLQNWYNNDKGKAIQQELTALLLPFSQTALPERA